MSKKVLYIDGSALVRNSQGGISHYTSALIDQLSQKPEFDVRVLVFKGDTVKTSAPIEYLPFNRRIYMGLWRVFPRLSVDRWLKDKPDAVIYPNFSMTPLVSEPSASTITVIHDLTFLHYPDTVEQKNRYFLKLAVERSCKNSDHIVTPSQFSLDDLKEHYKVKGEVTVAYPGYDPTNTEGEVRDLIEVVITSPYLLFIGTIEPRKNVAVLCNAFLRSSFHRSNYRLVIAGAEGWGDVNIPDNPAIVRLGTISNKERCVLLHNATAFTFPSVFEGFGMPVIEAMRTDIPVITSNSSSLREIASHENSYLVHEPFGLVDITRSLDELYNDLSSNSPRLKRRVVQAKRDASKYTWGRCAEVFANLILKI